MEPDPEPGGRPALPPDLLRKRAGGPPPPEPDVGDFRQGSPLSQWALSRYLVGRAVTESMGIALLLFALVLLGLAAVAEWALHSTALAVLVVLVAVSVLVLRRLLLAVVRRLIAVDRFGRWRAGWRPWSPTPGQTCCASCAGSGCPGGW